MANCRIEEVAEIMIKSARRMGLVEPSTGACAGVYNHCAKHGLETIREALFNLESVDTKSRYYHPLPIIKAAVKEILQHDKNKKHSIADERCRYSDHSESAISRAQCHKKLDENDARFSMNEYGKPICVWHRDVMHANLHPESAKANVVNFQLEFFAKLDASDDKPTEKHTTFAKYVNAA